VCCCCTHAFHTRAFGSQWALLLGGGFVLGSVRLFCVVVDPFGGMPDPPGSDVGVKGAVLPLWDACHQSLGVHERETLTVAVTVMWGVRD